MVSHYHHDFWRGGEGKKKEKELKPNDNKTPGIERQNKISPIMSSFSYPAFKCTLTDWTTHGIHIASIGIMSCSL